MIKRLRDRPHDLQGWEPVLFPSPIHSSLDYVYTIDQDAGHFTISQWGDLSGPMTPTVIRIDLETLYESSGLLIKQSVEQPQYISFDRNTCSVAESTSTRQSILSGVLNMDFGLPTPMNEMQERFFTHLVFQVLSIAFLRLAAWDFELSIESGTDVELPLAFWSMPTWDYPKTDIFWFHKFLIVLQEDIESAAMITKAVMKARSSIKYNPEHRDVRLILISPYHVAFVEDCHNATLASKSLVLLAN